MNNMIICRCEGVWLSEISRAIEGGANSVPGVKKRIRVGMGHCQGRVCQPIVSDMLETTASSNAKPVLQRAQTPVRPILLGDIIKK